MAESDGPSSLKTLRDGNRRFMEGEAKRFAEEEIRQRQALVEGQAPHAVILTCSDSRVSPELVFDQGLGDLFVVRIAGNVVAPGQLASIEYAVELLGTRLVVVLGHTRCGAVTATLDELLTPSPGLSPSLRALIDQIRPAVEASLAALPEERVKGEAVPLSAIQRQMVVEDAIQRNVRASKDALTRESEVLERLTRTGELTIVGAEYALEDGSVTFLD